MKHPFEIKEIDKKVYNNELKEFLSNKIIDIHTHIWLKNEKRKRITDL